MGSHNKAVFRIKLFLMWIQIFGLKVGIQLFFIWIQVFGLKVGMWIRM
jgi:hypothetical protein